MQRIFRMSPKMRDILAQFILVSKVKKAGTYILIFSVK